MPCGHWKSSRLRRGIGRSPFMEEADVDFTPWAHSVGALGATTPCFGCTTQKNQSLTSFACKEPVSGIFEGTSPYFMLISVLHIRSPYLFPSCPSIPQSPAASFMMPQHKPLLLKKTRFEQVFGLRSEAENRRLMLDVQLTEAYGVRRLPLLEGTLDLEVSARSTPDEKPVVTITTDVEFDLHLRWSGGEEIVEYHAR